MPKSRIYLAGPMSFRKDSDWNFPAFHEAAATLRGMGFEVENPAEHFDGDTSLPYEVYFRKDLKVLMDCDVIVTLPGWQQSKGASKEVDVALFVGIKHVEYDDLIDVRP